MVRALRAQRLAGGVEGPTQVVGSGLRGGIGPEELRRPLARQAVPRRQGEKFDQAGSLPQTPGVLLDASGPHRDPKTTEQPDAYGLGALGHGRPDVATPSNSARGHIAFTCLALAHFAHDRIAPIERPIGGLLRSPSRRGGRASRRRPGIENSASACQVSVRRGWRRFARRWRALRDLVVREAPGDQEHHLPLAARQLVGVGSRGCLGSTGRSPPPPGRTGPPPRATSPALRPASLPTSPRAWVRTALRWDSCSARSAGGRAMPVASRAASAAPAAAPPGRPHPVLPPGWPSPPGRS